MAGHTAIFVGNASDKLNGCVKMLVCPFPLFPLFPADFPDIPPSPGFPPLFPLFPADFPDFPPFPGFPPLFPLFPADFPDFPPFPGFPPFLNFRFPPAMFVGSASDKLNGCVGMGAFSFPLLP
jgi:hypothetical protein